MKARGNRALLGIVVANLVGALFILATIGALAGAQPATAHGAAQPQERAAQQLAPATNSITMVKLANTGSGDNSVVFNGEPITYTIVITNNSSSQSATNTVVIDKLPQDALQGIDCFTPCQQLYEQKQIPLPTGGTLVVTVTRSLSWTVSSLAPLASTQLVFGGRVVGQSDGTILRNRAQATYNFGNQPGSASTDQVSTTVHLRIGQGGQPSLASSPTWFSTDLGGTLSQDWGDFNGDGLLDLVLGSSLGTSVYINVGGKLQPYWNDYSLHRPAYGVRWADVNHSGKLSIVAVGDSLNGSAVTAGTNYIYGYTPLDPQNKFTQLSSFTSDYQMVRVAVGDFTGHKNVDIVASTNTLNADCPVRLFRNDGNGNFTGPGDCISHSATAALGPGDFDNSGRLSLAVGVFPNTIEILTNDGTGNFNATLPVTVATNLPFLPYDFAWGDYDGNGLLDLAAAFPLQKEARVYRNLGNGVFDSPLEPFRTSKFLSPLAVAWGDFNGDGRLDLLVADEAPRVYLNTGGAFNQAAPLTVDTVPGQVWSARAEQLSLNGDLNLALTDRDSASLLFDAFSPHLQSKLTQVDSSPASSLAIGDADGNGLLDLLLGAGSSPAQDTTLHYNTSGAFPTQVQLSTGLGPQSVAFGDVNGDGRLDIAVGTAVDAQLYLAGQFQPVWTASAPDFPNHIVAFCDVNNDGRLDLLVGANGGGVAVYLNQGGTLATAPSFVTPETGDVRAIACTDFRHDKYPGLAVAFYNQPVQVYGNNKNGTFTSVWNSGTHSQTTSLAWGDFNGSGFPSLAVGNDGQGTQVYENLNGQLQPKPIWSSPTQWHTRSIAWGDWNNDGSIDLAIGNYNQQAQVYGNLGSTPGQPRLFWLWTSADPYQTTGIAWGDFSGDGHLDLGLSQDGVCCNGYFRNGTITPSHLGNNFAPTLVLPNNPSYLSIKRPGITADAYANSASEILGGPAQPTVTVQYTLYDPNGSRAAHNAPGNTIAKSVFEYSLDGGSNWLPASPAAGWTGAVTTTSRLGQSANFIWDVLKDQAISDEARFRIRIVPYVPAGPVQTGSTSAISPPFRVRGVTCVWPDNPSIFVSPNPPTPTVPSNFFGSVSAGTGALTFTWAFGDNPNQTVQGQIVQHTFLSNGTFPVTMTVSGEPCPQNRAVVATRMLAVGSGVANLNIFLPLVVRPASSAGSAAPAAADPLSTRIIRHNAPPAIIVNDPSLAPTRSSTTSQNTGGAARTSPRSSGSGTLWQPTGPGSPGNPVTANQVTTQSVGINNEPSLNGDGTHIAFWSTANPTGNNPDGNIEVFMIVTRTTGLAVTQITSSTGSILGGFNLSPSIDNAGKRIAFFSDRDLTGANPDQNFEIFLYDTSTAVLTQVTHTTRGFNILPSISADGNYIAFASDRDLTGANPNGITQIFRARILPSGDVTFVQVTDSSAGTNDTPRINRDGTRITFVSTNNLAPGGGNADNNREVFLADVGPSGQVTFTQISNTTQGNTGEPTIDGDGQRIAYVSDQSSSGFREIFYADVDQNHNITVTQVTTSTFEVGNDKPSISLDGTRIGFVSPNIGEVRIFDTLLGGELTAAVGGGPSLNPAISGDGTVVAFAQNRQLYLTGYPLAELRVTKTVTPVLGFQSTPVTYTVVVSNAGPSAATNVVLTDTLGVLNGQLVDSGRATGIPRLNPANAGVCSSSEPFTCSLGTLAANASITLTLNVTPTTYGTLTNTAAVSTDIFQRFPHDPAFVSLPVQPLPVGAVDLLLAGPVTGTSDISSTFVASVHPITASVPLTYVWQVSNQVPFSFTVVNNSFTNTQTFAWDPGGVQTVTVFVSNAANNVVSNTRTITIFNPVPQLGSLFPPNALIDSPALTLVLTGAGFVRNSSVLWDNGAQTLDSGFVTTSSLTATVPASLMQAVGRHTISVQSPEPGGGQSGPLTFTVMYPAPTITDRLPVTAATGGPAFTLTITGSNFFAGASLFWDSQPISLTTFGNNSAVAPSSVVTVIVPANYLLTAGPLVITATNLPPNAGPSNAVGFNINNPTLSLSVNPTTIDTAATATLQATISDIQAGARTITLTSSNPAIIGVPATIILPPQTASVSVPITAGRIGGLAFITGTLPATIGGAQGSTSITVNYRTPVITGTLPVTTTAGGLTFSMTLSGSDFASGAQLFWDSQLVALPTFGSGSAVTVSVPASYIPNPGPVNIAVTNPAPNDGPSAAWVFTVVSPTIRLSPNNLTLNVNQTATVTASISAPQAGNRTLTITASSNFITFPPTIVLPAQAISTTFTITGGAVGDTGVITATLPDSLGGQFDTAQVTVNNSQPQITLIVPGTISVSIPATLDITGSGFTSRTQVRWNGITLTQTQFLSGGELTATVPVDLYLTTGPYPVTLFNPAPPAGGLTSGAVNVNVVNPAPLVQTMSPNSTTAGTPQITLVVTGSQFVQSSTIYWQGSARSTTYVNGGQLTADIGASDLAVPDAITVTVFTPGPGGGLASPPLNFTVATTTPVISAISPLTQALDGGPFTLVVTGTNFFGAPKPNKDSVILWNNGTMTATLPTTFVSSTVLTATVNPTALMQTAGVYTVTVFNPDPPASGLLSNSMNLTATNPVPVLSSISPTFTTAGSLTLTLTLNGDKFISEASTALWNGGTLSTTFIGRTQLTAMVGVAQLTTAGYFTINVQTAGPGGGLSQPLPFTVNNPVPLLVSVSPTSTVLNAEPIALVVTGTNFADNAQIVWISGTITTSLTTTVVSPTQLRATVGSAHFPVGGFYRVMVLNPPPPAGGVLSSNSLTVTINNPRPRLSTLTPNTTVAGTGAIAVTIDGGGFVPGAVGLWNLSSRSTVFVDAGTLQMGLQAGDVASVGTGQVTVQNPDPSVGGSNTSLPFTVTAPTVSLAPSTTQITLPGNGVLTATISDAQVASTVISLTSSNPSIVSVPATVNLTAGLTQTQFTLTTHGQVTGTVIITAQLPSALGGGISIAATAMVVVDQPIAGLTAANNSPTSLGGITTLTASFTAGTNVAYLWDFGDGTGITTANPTNHAYPVAAGNFYTAIVTATNSVSQMTTTTVVTITNPTPSVSSIAPITPTASLTQSQVITVTGIGFIAGAQVTIQDQPTGLISHTYTATVTSQTQLHITVAAGDFVASGTYNLFVINPEPPVAIVPRTSNKWMFHMQ